MADPENPEAKQCRICFDGEDPELGRLIRPCLCKGSISHVHVKCLQRWRNSSPNRSAFYSCPQCGYKYHFARTRAVGLATNPVAIAAVSSVLFTILVLCSSFVTTWMLSDDSETTYQFYYGWYSPIDVIQNLVRASVSIFLNEPLSGRALLKYPKSRQTATVQPQGKPPGILKRLLRRFLLGLPVVGAGSIAHMLLSVPLPFHWFNFRRLNRGRDSRDLAALLIVVLVLIGAARALYKVYHLTERFTKRLLLRAEDAILEVA